MRKLKVILSSLFFFLICMNSTVFAEKSIQTNNLLQKEDFARGPRGRRGPRGYCGYRGHTGEKGKKGKQGKPGKDGTSFVSTFGTWNVVGNVETPLASGAIIPFSINEASSGITNSSGDFTLSKSGVYQVTFGVQASDPTTAVFDLELNGTLVSGGRLITINNGIVYPLTVMFSATAGDHLVVRNANGIPATIGSILNPQFAIAAFISILQIQ